MAYSYKRILVLKDVGRFINGKKKAKLLKGNYPSEEIIILEGNMLIFISNWGLASG
jgi:hypothetical protein